MNDRDALLAAVLASPDDDVPRLVFADWLEETGHPADAARAHYIRHQVEATRFPPDSAGSLLHARAAAAHRGSFFDEADQALGETAHEHGVAVIRRRGFVDELRIGGATSRILPGCSGLFGVAPVRLLDMAAPADPFGRIEHGEWLGRLRELRVRCQYGARDEGTNAVAGCRWLKGLVRLNLSRNGLSDAWVVEFVRRFDRSAFATSLRELDLSRNFGITNAGASALTAARGLDGLMLINLVACGINQHGITLLRRRFGERVVV